MSTRKESSRPNEKSQQDEQQDERRLAVRESLGILCEMKNHDLTLSGMGVWCDVLSVFPVEIVNLAILEFGLTICSFPDLSRIVHRCEELRKQRSSFSSVRDELSEGTIAAIADALRIVISEVEVKRNPMD